MRVILQCNASTAANVCIVTKPFNLPEGQSPYEGLELTVDRGILCIVTKVQCDLLSPDELTILKISIPFNRNDKEVVGEHLTELASVLKDEGWSVRP